MFKHIFLIACAVSATVVPFAAGLLAASAVSLSVFAAVTLAGLIIGFVGVALFAVCLATDQAEG